MSVLDDRKTSPALYKVLRTIPQRRNQLAYLEQLEHNATDLQLNFWTSPTRLNSPVDLMVPAGQLEQMQRDFFEQGLASHIIINDVEK